MIADVVPSMVSVFWCVTVYVGLAQWTETPPAVSLVYAEVLLLFSSFWSRITRTVTPFLAAVVSAVVIVVSSSSYMVRSMVDLAEETRA
jgi:hypothetical protein